ncbi:MAG TPA: ThiF family adenylyltransferase [Allosphingosinicella sp.]
MLDDLSREQFCLLLGKKQEFEGGFCINVIEVLSPGPEGYQSHSLGHVSPRKDFILYALGELQERWDVDTLIDVHTHPFSVDGVRFSSIDDRDEIEFLSFINKNFDDIHYASVVFSQEDYEARYWDQVSGKATWFPLIIRTPTFPESIKASTGEDEQPRNQEDGFSDRTALALGRAAFESILASNSILVVGMGGLGSVIAENLVHMGFPKIILVDDDIVEESNLNRIVGAYWEDAQLGTSKVDAVARHLRAIRPDVEIISHQRKIEDVDVDAEIASVAWIVAATDNHSSRFYSQQLAFRFFIPLISAGVSITVKDDRIADYSGEVIVVRPGDKLCLVCLGRVNPTKIAAERATEIDQGQPSRDSDAVRPDLERLRSYVEGAEVAEPAVKTLNSVVGALAVEQLINQYTRRVRHEPILVYEINRVASVYADQDSLRLRNKTCSVCGVIA